MNNNTLTFDWIISDAEAVEMAETRTLDEIIAAMALNSAEDYCEF